MYKKVTICLFLKKGRGRHKYKKQTKIKNISHAYAILHRQNTFNL